MHFNLLTSPRIPRTPIGPGGPALPAAPNIIEEMYCFSLLESLAKQQCYSPCGPGGPIFPCDPGSPYGYRKDAEKVVQLELMIEPYIRLR